jgi:hypothetical protein
VFGGVGVDRLGDNCSGVVARAVLRCEVPDVFDRTVPVPFNEACVALVKDLPVIVFSAGSIQSMVWRS